MNRTDVGGTGIQRPAGGALSGFTGYVGIDWSGAKGARHPGIAVALARPGEDAPTLIAPQGRYWSRTAVGEWLRAAAVDERLLVGFDFSFAPPYAARGAYLPGATTAENGPGFWAYVDGCCGDEDLGAASFLESRHRPHFYFGAADGRKADYMHPRVCEAAFNAGGGGKASTIFDAIGAAQVAKASFSGMRLLHRLRASFAVWPFDSSTLETGVIVEIYARAFIRLAGGRGLKLRDRDSLELALSALGSCPLAGNAVFDDHQSDAIIAAAGLRAIAGKPHFWQPDGLTCAIARTEGWTFGVL